MAESEARPHRHGRLRMRALRLAVGPARARPAPSLPVLQITVLGYTKGAAMSEALRHDEIEARQEVMWAARNLRLETEIEAALDAYRAAVVAVERAEADDRLMLYRALQYAVEAWILMRADPRIDFEREAEATRNLAKALQPLVPAAAAGSSLQEGTQG